MRRLLLLSMLVAGIACHRDPPAAEVITPAVRVAGTAEIPYPPDLFATRTEGTVLLYLFIDSTGAVVNDSSRIARTSGQAAFDAAALQAAPHLRFTPAHRGDVPVAAPIQVPIIFTLPDSLKAK